MVVHYMLKKNVYMKVFFYLLYIVLSRFQKKGWGINPTPIFTPMKINLHQFYYQLPNQDILPYQIHIYVEIPFLLIHHHLVILHLFHHQVIPNNKCNHITHHNLHLQQKIIDFGVIETNFKNNDAWKLFHSTQCFFLTKFVFKKRIAKS